YVVDAAIRAIAEQPVALKDAHVLVMGATFKKDVADARHSLAEPILRLLRDKNVQNITLADPLVDEFAFDWSNGQTETIRTQPLTTSLVDSAHVVILITDHTVFDYNMVAARARHIVDTRNAFSHIEARENITLVGGGQY
ncbi:MAG TPA: UDP binding domain-containing protein, partial [Rhodothermales bacterium]|nr:UDP binding domain-containing protein [Rhodothermales bacterium]